MATLRFRNLDRVLNRLSLPAVFGLALCGSVVVGIIDYHTGYEVSLSLFYVGPVALATWYGNRPAGVVLAVVSCIAWYYADVAAGSAYSHPAIPVWNAIIRLGFFLLASWLLAALRKELVGERTLARTDSLTGLFARRVFEDRLRQDLALAQRRGSMVSLAYVDLDNLKSINDAAGHGEGDRVLKAVGRVLRSSIRAGDTAARVGGDEFAVVLPDTGRLGAEEVISRIRTGLRDTLGAGQWPTTCSVGVATFLDATISAESAIAAADALMYEVKRSSKNAVVYREVGSHLRTPFREPPDQPPRADPPHFHP